MRHLLLSGLLFITCTGQSQVLLAPGNASVQTSWISNRQYDMNWYFLKDTMKTLMGTVSTEISKDEKNLLVITKVHLKNMNKPWIDSSVALLPNLSPVYHSSYNMQRDMVLRFGTPVTGYYDDHIRKKQTVIADTIDAPYYDSNVYPYLISLLPLTEGYSATIPIYDFNPSGKKGLLRAFVKNVAPGEFVSEKSGVRKVWVVQVSDEIGGGENGVSTYYFDQQDRRLWKQEISAGGRRMLMLASEK